MSSFICEKCNAKILDTELGYITGCEHYPMAKVVSIIPEIRKREDEKRLEDKEAIRAMCQ